MAIMLKGNRQIRVSEARRADYLKRGYNEIDEAGKVITRSVAGLSPEAKKEIEVLTADNVKLTAELDAAQAENEKLRKEIETLKKK